MGKNGNIRYAAKVVVGMGAAFTVGLCINRIVKPETLKLIPKIMVLVGGGGIGGAVGLAAEKYVDDTFDSFEEVIEMASGSFETEK